MKQDKRLVYGIGINDADYTTQPTIDGKMKMCPYYRKWTHMLERCYSDNFKVKRPTYIGCSVATEWHSFMNFRAWMQEQDWQGKQLDKDILNPNNKIYSAEACMFVTSAINNLLLDSKAIRGDYPQGVCYNKRDQKYLAQIKINGKRKNLGYHDTPSQAEQSYLKAKATYIKQHIEDNKHNPRLIVGLEKHLKLIEDKIGSM